MQRGVREGYRLYAGVAGGLAVEFRGIHARVAGNVARELLARSGHHASVTRQRGRSRGDCGVNDVRRDLGEG